jgi:hypothetical protein
MKFEIITLDVWGNSDDGFEVNNAFSTGAFVDLLEVQWDEEGFIEVNYRETGEYFLQLRAVDSERGNAQVLTLVFVGIAMFIMQCI